MLTIFELLKAEWVYASTFESNTPMLASSSLSALMNFWLHICKSNANGSCGESLALGCRGHIACLNTTALFCYVTKALSALTKGREQGGILLD